MDKRPSSAKARRECFDEHRKTNAAGKVVLECHICGTEIDPVREPWEAEHVIPHAFGGKAMKPAHERCHKVKTATQDVPAIAKSKRASDKHFGIRRKGWGGKWKKKVSGEVVER